MRLLREHLLAVVLFPLGVTATVVPVSMVLVRVNEPTFFLLVPTLGPVVAIAGVAALVGLTAYDQAIPRRRAEWTVLAPVLASGLVVTLHLTNIGGNLVWGPRGLIHPPGTLGRVAVVVVLFLAVCLGLAAIAIRWMKGFPQSMGRGDVWRELAAVAILVPFSLWPRTATTAIAHAMGWGVGETLAEAWENAHLALALGSGLALVGLLVPCVLVAGLLWRGRPAETRWRGIALAAMWITASTWLAQMYRWFPQMDYDNWLQRAGTGVVAGALALAYVHGVVVPMWRRARRVEPPHRDEIGNQEEEDRCASLSSSSPPSPG